MDDPASWSSRLLSRVRAIVRDTSMRADSPREVAQAVFVGWLPLVAINAVFVRRVPMVLDPRQSVLHHLYDAGQLLGLALASWLVARLAWQVSPLRRSLGGFFAAWPVCHALLAGDLEDFLARHAADAVPWHLVFSASGALGLTMSVMLGRLLDRGAWWLVGLGLGLALGVLNHLVLRLSYPGAHFLAAWTAAWLVGTSSVSRVAGLRVPRVVRTSFAALSVLSLASYAVIPGPVLRSALLGSSGAVAAPFVARAWALVRDPAPVAVVSIDSPWYRSRWDLPPIPPEPMPGAPRAPVVVLVTIDALRADLLEHGGAEAEATRALRAMARKALSFERAWSPAAYTMASLRSLFLGTYHVQHGKRSRKKPAADRSPLKTRRAPFLAELLEAAGVRTVKLRTISALAGNRSVSRGFREEYRVPKHSLAAGVVREIVDRLGKHPKGPLFMYTHILDPHAPYSAGGSKGTPKQRYLAEVAQVDRAIGRLRRALRRQRAKTTYLIVTSDHAEAFGEHGHDYHATTSYEEMIRVPLLIEGPGVVARRVKEPASLMDLGPTILSLFGAPTPGHVMGESLVPLMRGEDRELSRPLVSVGGRAQRAMLFERRWKVLVDPKRGTEEVYDLEQDPGERNNLAETPEARPYLARLRAFFAALARP